MNNLAYNNISLFSTNRALDTDLKVKRNLIDLKYKHNLGHIVQIQLIKKKSPHTQENKRKSGSTNGSK
jgi:hypothetical protein